MITANGYRREKALPSRLAEQGVPHLRGHLHPPAAGAVALVLPLSRVDAHLINLVRTSRHA
jgi:hypothetical protein